MAKVPLQKIRIAGVKRHYKILMQELHRAGNLEIVETSHFLEKSREHAEDHFGVFDLARIDFALKFLTPHQSKEEKLESVLTGGKIILSEAEAKKRLESFSKISEKVVGECEKIEETIVLSTNQLEKIAQKKKILSPFRSFRINLQKSFDTEKTVTWIGMVRKSQEEAFVGAVSSESHLVDVQVIERDGMNVYMRLTASREIAGEVTDMMNGFQFEVLDFSLEFEEFFGKTPREALRFFEKEEERLEKEIEAQQKRTLELTKHITDLRVLYDYNAWRKRKNDLQHNIFCSSYVFAFEAWMPKVAYKHFQKWIRDVFVGEVIIEKAEIAEDEEIPTYIQNKSILSSYEPVTEMFGIPGNKDIDPTPYLAPFFFVFFGLCLSDVGYGTILMIVSLYFLIRGTFGPKVREGILLLLFCGFGAFLGGIVLGGYFGITPEQAPTFLLNPDYIAGVEGVTPFRGQLLDPMSGSGPITFLMVTMAIGIVQLLVGVLLSFVTMIKNKRYLDAFCDPFAWFFFLFVLVGFALADKLGLNKEIFKTLSLIGAGILVVTQGRHQKNWFLKPISGVLGLYNVTGYVSDLLSYSRIMALGLATGVIGFAMNLTAGILGGMMPHPILGFVIAVAFLLFGHSLNFSLSLLGAFVHSGRLQFIEFFGKFFEGDGRKFKPFVREKKYLFFQDA